MVERDERRYALLCSDYLTEGRVFGPYSREEILEMMKNPEEKLESLDFGEIIPEMCIHLIICHEAHYILELEK